jgi:farnesyl-diphosphate farnesyltransferase
MMVLGRSFGQSLQMTNILKDVWDDLERGACWLPRSVFDEVGFDLSALRRGQSSPELEGGLSELIGIAHGHLANALDYTLRIPAAEDGIRKFCLWTLGWPFSRSGKPIGSGDTLRVPR